MGQGPSASRPSEDGSLGGGILAGGGEGDVGARRPSRDDLLICNGGGCLPVPRCLVVPFLSHGGGPFEAAAKDDWEEESLPGLMLVDADVDERDDDEHDVCDEHAKHDDNIIGDKQSDDDDDGQEDASPPSIPEGALSKMVAVDCGMAQGSELRRVCVVDGHGCPLLSALVRVDEKEKKFHSSLGQFLSGLLPRAKTRRVNRCGDDLDVGVPASQVMEDASRLLRGKVVVGHDVGGDLAVLGLCRHGNSDFEVRDTSTYIPFMEEQQTSAGPRSRKARLRDLVRDKLHRDIQPDGMFHCCEEDAIAALDLYKSVWHEWEACLKSPDSKGGRSGQSRVKQPQQNQRRPPRKTGNTSSSGVNGRTAKQKKKRSGGKRQKKNMRVQPVATTQRKPPNKKKKSKKKRKNAKTLGIAPKPQRMKLSFASASKIRLFGMFRAPIGIVQDLVRLTREAVVSIKQIVQQKPKSRDFAGRKLSDRTQEKRNKKKKAKGRKTPLSSRRHCRFEDVLLVLHMLLEARAIFSFAMLCANSPTECLDGESVQRAYGSLALGLVGLGMLWKEGPRNDAASRVVRGVLLQYRLFTWLLSTVGLYWQENALAIAFVALHY